MFGNILKMLFSYKFFTFSQPFSQLPTKFYIRKSTSTHTSAPTENPPLSTHQHPQKIHHYPHTSTHRQSTTIHTKSTTTQHRNHQNATTHTTTTTTKKSKIKEIKQIDEKVIGEKANRRRSR